MVTPRSIGCAARGLALILALATGPGCGGGEQDAVPADAGVPRGPCETSARVGSFEAALQADFTSVQGKVQNGVTPILVPDVIASEGACRLLRPPVLFCDPACSGATTCDATGTCIPTPSSVDVGAVSARGLSAPVEMTATAPVFFYTNPSSLPHPGFAPGDSLALAADGRGDVDAFSLFARGVAALDVPAASVALAPGAPTVVRWTPAPDEGDGAGDPAAQSGMNSAILIDLNIALHGGNPASIECELSEVSDEANGGEFTIPVALTDQLLALGFSGFPLLVLTRRSVDSTDIAFGCVQWLAQSRVALDVEIPGLTSCNGDEDCPQGQTCQPDLTCQ